MRAGEDIAFEQIGRSAFLGTADLAPRMDMGILMVKQLIVLLFAGFVDPDEWSAVGLHHFAAGLSLLLLREEGGGDEGEQVAREHGVHLSDVHHLHLSLRSTRQPYYLLPVDLLYVLYVFGCLKLLTLLTLFDLQTLALLQLALLRTGLRA